MDTTRQTRMRLADLLSRLGPLAESAEPAMARLLHDEGESVSRSFRDQPELAVPALLEGLRNTNTLVACQSIWLLENFKDSAGLIVPALEKAAQRPDNVAGHCAHDPGAFPKRHQRHGSTVEAVIRRQRRICLKSCEVDRVRHQHKLVDPAIRRVAPRLEILASFRLPKSLPVGNPGHCRL